MIGCILAGGRSRRMGGGDKALRLLGGRPVLAHVIARLRPQLDRVVLNANGDAGRFAAFGLPVVADGVETFPGPLAGVLAALDHAAERGEAGIVTVPCDTPFLPPDLVARLTASGRLTVAASRGRVHPVVGWWPSLLRPQIAEALAGGRPKLMPLIASLGAAEVGFADIELKKNDGESLAVDPFHNLNTPDDLAAAEAWLHLYQSS